MKKLFLFAMFLFLTCESESILMNHENVGLRKNSNRIVYLSESGNDSNPGTISKPVKTLRKAIELADGAADIYATVGQYSTPSRTDLNVSLYGGYSNDFSRKDSSNETVFLGTGYWGDPLPVIQVIERSNIIIDGITIQIGMSANGKPCAIYFERCDSTVILQNCRIIGQIGGDAKGMSAIYINEASPKILNNYIYGGTLNIDVDAVNGIKAVYSKSLIQGNVINAGKNQGCLHGIYSLYSKLRIFQNVIYGGESGESCYACAIRTGKAIESWDDSGSEDEIENNEIYGGIGNRTYAIIASQGSIQKIRDNIIDGGAGTVVSIGIYVKTNDHPYIFRNTFQNCAYGSYEWNFGDYAPGETNNASCIRENMFRASARIFVHWYDEIENSEHDVSNLDDLVQTNEGLYSLKYWNNSAENVSQYIQK